MENQPIRRFFELSSEEQREIVQAHENGATIEIYLVALNDWRWTRNPLWIPDLAYRIAR
jgi:hypothetical protein